MSQTKLLILINFILLFIGFDLYLIKTRILVDDDAPIVVQRPVQPIVEPPPPPEPINYDIETPIPSFLEYDALVSQLKKWEEEAPELVTVETYGSSSKGKELYYICVTNERIESDAKLVTMFTGCTHGNEPWSTTTLMAVVGTLLDKYGDDEQVTELLDTRTMYFVPVISPDSYPHSRHVDGVDPNRDYPTARNPDKQSVKPIEEFKELFQQVKPRAAISGHTHGRVYFYPWAEATRKTPNDADYRRILGKMGELSRYRMEQGCYNYGRPIYGSDMDYFHRNGALGVVMEFGTHQRRPTDSEVKSEFDRTYKAILHFFEEAPKVEVQQFSMLDWQAAA